MNAAFIAAADGATIQNHHGKCSFAIRKKVYQGRLMDPIDLSKHSLDAVATRSRSAASGCKADKNRYAGAGLPLRNYSIHEPDTAVRRRTDVPAASVEQRADEALLLEPESAWKPRL